MVKNRNSNVFRNLNEEQKLEFGKLFIRNKKDHIKKENGFIVFKFCNEFGIINIESKYFEFYDNRKEAIKHIKCFKKKVKVKQIKLTL